MTIQSFAELCIRALGFNNNEKIEERDALGIADIERAVLIREMLNNGGNLTSEYYMEFTAPLEYDKQMKLPFIYKPCQLLNLPHHQAYRYVGTGNTEDSYLPMTWAEIVNYSRLEAGQAGGRTIFSPLEDKVYFRYMPEPRPSNIKLLLVPSLLWMYENEDDNDLLGTDSLAGEMFDMILQRLQIRRQTPIDNYNNNKP